MLLFRVECANTTPMDLFQEAHNFHNVVFPGCWYFMLGSVRPDVLNIIYLAWTEDVTSSLLWASTSKLSVPYFHIHICLASGSPPCTSSSSLIICYALLSQQTNLSRLHGEARFPFQIRGCLFCTGVWMRFHTTPNKLHYPRKWAGICLMLTKQLWCDCCNSGSVSVCFWLHLPVWSTLAEWFCTCLSRCLCDVPDELSKLPWKNFCRLPSPQRSPYHFRSFSIVDTGSQHASLDSQSHRNYS